MPAKPDHAQTFHDLHRDFLILPNAWDAASALLMVEAGAKAIATSSAAVAWTHGYADGNHLPISRLAVTVEEMARSVSSPITVDCESGYAADPAEVGENIAKLIQVGAVGVNLEDGHEPHELHLKKVEAARRAAEREGVNLYINARTDVFLKQLVPEERMRAETMQRIAALRSVGASGIFIPGVLKAEDIGQIVAPAGLPVNVLSMPGAPDASALKALGVKRLSAGGALFHVAMAAARAAATEFLARGQAEDLWKHRGQPLEYNRLFAAQA